MERGAELLRSHELVELVASHHAHGAAVAARHLAELGRRRVGPLDSALLMHSEPEATAVIGLALNRGISAQSTGAPQPSPECTRVDRSAKAGGGPRHDDAPQTHGTVG